MISAGRPRLTELLRRFFFVEATSPADRPKRAQAKSPRWRSSSVLTFGQHLANYQHACAAAQSGRRQIRKILDEGEVLFREPHVATRMKERNISKQDINNVLRAGIVGEGEWEMGEWRHHVRTASFTVVIAFPEEMLLAICTCWRNER